MIQLFLAPRYPSETEACTVHCAKTPAHPPGCLQIGAAVSGGGGPSALTTGSNLRGASGVLTPQTRSWGRSLCESETRASFPSSIASFAAPRLCAREDRFPTARAVGYILSPLRGCEWHPSIFPSLHSPIGFASFAGRWPAGFRRGSLRCAPTRRCRRLPGFRGPRGG